MPVPGDKNPRLDGKNMGYTLAPRIGHDAPACAYLHGVRPSAHDLGGQQEQPAGAAFAGDRMGEGDGMGEGEGTGEGEELGGGHGMGQESGPSAQPQEAPARPANDSATASLTGSEPPSVVHSEGEHGTTAAATAQGEMGEGEANPMAEAGEAGMAEAVPMAVAGEEDSMDGSEEVGVEVEVEPEVVSEEEGESGTMQEGEGNTFESTRDRVAMEEAGAGVGAVGMASEVSPFGALTDRFKLKLIRPPAHADAPRWWVIFDLETRRYECGCPSDLHLGEQPLDESAASALEAQYMKEYKVHEEGVRFPDPAMRKLAVALLEANEAIPWKCVKQTFSNKTFVAAVKSGEDKDKRVGLQASAGLASRLLSLENNIKADVRGKGLTRENWRLKVQVHADNKGESVLGFSRRSRLEPPPPPDAANREQASRAATELTTLTWELLTSLAWPDMKSE
jgi:hypothetical protein